nr:zinc-finger homeodomain protein 4-like [Ipomoea batatas]
MVRYRECLKNHAASMGGNATDGCGEFMPSGEEGSLEALTCSACNCHRNFHRKEVEGEPLPPPPLSLPCDCYHHNSIKRKVFVGHHKALPGPEPPLGGGGGYPRAAAAAVPHQMIMSYNMATLLQPSESDEHEEQRPSHQLMVKKRFRTKFTQEQKDKMLSFAERVGWKIQKQEESVVQQFCQEVGVKRRVLKVKRQQQTSKRKETNINGSLRTVQSNSTNRALLLRLHRPATDTAVREVFPHAAVDLLAAQQSGAGIKQQRLRWDGGRRRGGEIGANPERLADEEAGVMRRGGGR